MNSNNRLKKLAGLNEGIDKADAEKWIKMFSNIADTSAKILPKIKKLVDEAESGNGIDDQYAFADELARIIRPFRAIDTSFENFVEWVTETMPANIYGEDGNGYDPN